jgi:hypothetical protein
MRTIRGTPPVSRAGLGRGARLVWPSLAAAMIACLTVSCGEPPSAPPTTDQAILTRIKYIVVAMPVPSVSIIVPGTTVTLLAQASDDAGVALPVVSYAWSSSDTTFAVVDADGRMTARKSGGVVISAEAGGKTGVLYLDIRASGAYQVIPDTSQLLVGQQRALMAVLPGGPYASPPVTVTGAWTSSDPAVVAVDGNGTVTALKPGRATLRYPPDAAITSGLTASVFVPDTPLPLRFLQLVTGYSSPEWGDEIRGFYCGRTQSDTWCWGDPGPIGNQLGTTAQVDRCRLVRHYGRYDEILFRRCAMEPVRVEAPAPFATIGNSVTTTPCGVTGDGRAYCWGDTRVITGLATGSETPVLISPTLRFSSFEFPCGVTTAHEAFCWVLPTLRDSVAPVLPIRVGGAISWRSVAGGNTSHRCGITSADVAMCWGANDAGQLGIGTTVESATPVPVASTETFSSVVVRPAATCGLTTTGALRCWGAGQSTPAAFNPGVQFMSLTAGQYGYCAVAAGGGVYCGGPGTLGKMTADTDFQSVAGDQLQRCGLRSDARLYCVGANTYGQLGVGDQLYRNTPTRVLGQ